MISPVPNAELAREFFPSSNRAQRLFDLLDTVLPKSEHGPAALTSEIELRYFSLQKDLKSVFTSDKSSPEMIVQHYFPNKLVPLVSWFAFRSLGLVSKWNKTPITRARLRSVAGKDGTEYLLNVKGPKVDFTRLDLVLLIPKRAFESLLPYATDGSATKYRYQVQGKTSRGVSICAHIDVPVAGGDGDRLPEPGLVRTKKGNVKFAITEIETQNIKAIAQIIEGDHTFPFLDKAIPLWLEQSSIRDPLRSRRLAKSGFGSDFIDAVKSLAKRCA